MGKRVRPDPARSSPTRFPEEYAAWLRRRRSPRWWRARRRPSRCATASCRRCASCLAALEPGETGIVVLHGACLQGRPDGAARLAAGSSRGSLQGLENCGYCVLSEHAVRGGLRLTSYNEKAGRLRGTDPISQPTGRLARIPRVACRTGGQRSGAVAQLVAHLHGMQRVRGSSPLSSTGGSQRAASWRRGAAGSGSVIPGRWHAGGQGFESPQLHQARALGRRSW